MNGQGDGAPVTGEVGTGSYAVSDQAIAASSDTVASFSTGELSVEGGGIEAHYPIFYALYGRTALVPAVSFGVLVAPLAQASRLRAIASAAFSVGSNGTVGLDVESHPAVGARVRVGAV